MKFPELFPNQTDEVIKVLSQKEREEMQQRWSDLHYIMEKTERSGAVLAAEEKVKIEEEMERLRQKLTNQ